MTDLVTLSGEALVAALAIDIDATDNDALTAAIAEQRKAGDEMFARTTPTIAQVRDAVAVNASVKGLEAEQAKRKAAVEAAAAEFAAARAEFADDAEAKKKADAKKAKEGKDGEKAKPFALDDETIDEADEDEDDESDADEDAEGDDESDDEVEGDEGDEGDGEAVVTASDQQVITAAAVARKVGKKTKRPVRLADQPVTLTASGENTGFTMGQKLNGHDDLAKGFLKVAKNFPKFSAKAGQARRQATGGVHDIKPFDLATFGLNIPGALVADGGGGKEHNVVRHALAEHHKALTAALKVSSGGTVGLKDALTAAGWCAPSEPVYSYIADYVVDGLLTLPQVGAPRGGLLLTTGPARSSQGAALDDFGFVQTEAQAEAGMVKTLEAIECPDFFDHRLDAIGYGFTIPFLTQKAYPELVADALKFAGVLWAHKLNARRINQILALSDAVTFEGYGPSVTDSLEVLSLIAVHERRKWNIGRNAIMEVKLPEIALEVFRADMSRRSGLALDDVATEQKINAHFAARGLAVEYLSDWAEITYSVPGAVVLPGEFPAVIYPSGTFIEAVEDVVNLSAIYDAASITVNEYTGVFFEQGQMVAKAGYGASKLTIPVNTAGQSGAQNLTGVGDFHEGDGSF